MDLLKIARVPPVTIESKKTVLDAVKRMSDTGAGAVVIVDDDRAIGIFTASDLLRRVVAKGRRLEKTRLSEVATFPLTVAHTNTKCDDALRLMVENHIRHLPIVDQDARVPKRRLCSAGPWKNFFGSTSTATATFRRSRTGPITKPELKPT